MKDFVNINKGNFILNGKVFRFIGSNVYELANVEDEISYRIIDDSFKCGFSVLRFWLFENRTLNEQIKKLHKICNYAGSKDIRLVISLADKWGYLQNYKIDEAWYKEGYKKSYLNYVKKLCSEFKDRHEIIIWELINEPSTDCFDSIYHFTKSTSEVVKSVNENHIISLGTVGGIGDKFGGYISVFKKENFRKLYLLPSIDAISIHDYSYDSGLLERLEVLFRFKGNLKVASLFEKLDSLTDMSFDKIDNKRLQKGKLTYIPFTLRWLWNRFNKKDISFSHEIHKPLYIGEIGFKSLKGRDRAKLLDLDLANKFSSGIGGYILWSFESQGWSKDGHGYGFGLHDGFCEIVKKWNNEFNNQKINLNGE